MENLLTNLNNWGNKYLSLAHLIDSNNKISSDALLNILELVPEENDINELMIYKVSKDYKQEYTIKISGLINILEDANFLDELDWETSKIKELFDKMYEKGLDFNNELTIFSVSNINIEEYQKIRDLNDLLLKIEKFDKKKHSGVYSLISEYGSNKKNDDKIIFLLRKAYMQSSQEKFNEKIKNYNTLHDAVKFSKEKIIKFLIEDCNVPIDILSNMGQTPLFAAKNKNILELLDKYQPNWLHQDYNGNDVMTIFSRYDKEISKELVYTAQEKMKSLINNSKNIPKDLVSERLKATLLEMVKKDKTKKEITDFIKRYNITDFKDIRDEKGNNLVHICISNGSWVKADMFIDNYDINEKNEDGFTYINQILLKNHVSYENNAKSLVSKLITKGCFDKDLDFAECYLNEKIEQGRNFNLPNWYFYNRKFGDETLNNLFRIIIQDNQNILKDDMIKDFESLNLEKTSWSNSRDKNVINKSLYFMLAYNVLFNKGFEISNLNYKNILNEVNIDSVNEINAICISKNSFEGLIEIIGTANKFNYFKTLKTQEAYEKLEDFCMKNLLVNFKKIEDQLNNKNIKVNESDKIKKFFFQEYIHVIEFYINNNSNILKETFEYSTILNDFRDYIKENKYNSEDKEKIMNALDYITMSNTLKYNKDIKQQIKKNKI